MNILVGGNTSIPFNVTASTLQSAVRSSGIVGFNNIEIGSYSDYGCQYSCSWIISYKGFNNVVPSITASPVGLSGGATSPTLTTSTRRNYSPNIVFDPIDYRFLNTVSAGINVQVKTNGVPAVCTGTCLYTFNTYTEITALSYSGTTLSLALSDPTSANFVINTITVTVGGQPCTVNGGSTLASLTCTMAANTNGSPILVAGSVTPVVAVGAYGIAGLATGVSPLSVSLVTSSLSVSTGGNNGGYLITLNGVGFPLDKSKMTITICGNRGTIK